MQVPAISRHLEGTFQICRRAEHGASKIRNVKCTIMYHGFFIYVRGGEQWCAASMNLRHKEGEVRAKKGKDSALFQCAVSAGGVSETGVEKWEGDDEVARF